MSNLENFDPNSVGIKGNNIFGLPFHEEDASLIIIPAPWEVTVSYRAGTSKAPEEVMEASLQIDLYDPDGIDKWKNGYYMLPVDKAIKNKSDYLRSCSELIIGALTEGEEICNNEQLSQKLIEVNEGGKYFQDWIYNLTKEKLATGKKIVLLGGDHSTPLGYMKAVAEKFGEFGILQIDAHADLRKAYENFTYSHASIMYNVLNEIPEVSKLVQVGIRDYCDEELEIINNNKRVKTYFDKNIKEAGYEGQTWKNICDDIISNLPQQVYISFDIDGLDPKLCPNTGTPVPGGFELDQVFYLFNQITKSGKTIIAFDLNEVSSGNSSEDSIDPLVGARALYKMCNILMNQAS